MPGCLHGTPLSQPQSWFPQFRIKIVISAELLTSSYWCLMKGQMRFLRHPPTRPKVELKYVYIYACVYFKLISHIDSRLCHKTKMVP